MASHCPQPCYDLREEGEEEALCVLKAGSFQEKVVSRLVEEEGALSGRVTQLDHSC